jgi:hypothetical protein
MKRGYLSEYFTGVTAKRLSSVEVNPEKSHQHEFNGDEQLKTLFGSVRGVKKVNFPAIFMYFGEDTDRNITEKGNVTWYDARAKSHTRTGRSEYRLYFSDVHVERYAQKGDLLIVARRANGSVVVIVSERNSTIEQQLIYLFQLQVTDKQFYLSDIINESDRQLDYVAKYTLAEIGVEVDDANDSFLNDLLGEFHGYFPATTIFSEYARNTLKNVDPIENPDLALMLYMDREEVLFKTLEKYLVQKKLKTGFKLNVDDFISYSLSVQNRRKMRSGMALENHLSHIFHANGIRFSSNKITENNSRPDFIFPGIKEYRDPGFPKHNLTMLGAKTTCKDRWRQVLTEAKRITNKHLFTLEPGISENQTDEMKSNKLSLVVPESIKTTYNSRQQSWLINLKDFVGIVR